MERRISRRQFGQLGVGAAAALTLSGVHSSVFAQDDTQDIEPIQSTRRGEMPTTGGVRPGPMGLEPAPVQTGGAVPIAIEVDQAAVNAPVEVIEIVNGVMQNPTGPWVVSWYKETARLGEVGNAVLAGHLDYWDVGPAVFYNIGSLSEGDPIVLTGDDGVNYTYETEWNQLFDAVNAPIQEIVGPTDHEAVTLITCGGPFDYQTGEYLQRTVVRARRKAS